MGKFKRDRARPLIGVRLQKVSEKLHYTTNRVAHAFKVGKGFERQKLSRRQKKAQEDGNEKDMQRIQAEIDALKALDLRSIARLFYLKYLHKNKDISKSGMFGDLIILPEATIEGPTQNVVARLCNTQPVKKAFQDGHDDVLQAAGIPLPKLARKDRGRMERMRTRETLSNDEFSPDEDEEHTGESRPQPKTMSKGSDEAVGWAIDEVGAESFVPVPAFADTKRKRDVSSESDDSGVIDVDSDDSSDSDEAAHAPASKKTRPTTSTILPSLTTGFVSGSDDSEIEDIDAAPRKNRRGQRARQAIHEQKYGHKAKHLHNKASRDQGWDPKRGATDGGSKHFGKPRTNGRADKAVDSGAPRTKPKPKRDDSGPLHPSWEAAKQAKAKSGAIPAFSGKKISFD